MHHSHQRTSHTAMRNSKVIFVGLGANTTGSWGPPQTTLSAAVKRLESAGLLLHARSSSYLSNPIGYVRQAQFLNEVLVVESSLTPLALLRLFKQLEREAGRRLGSRWGPRPLDIDILDYRGKILNQPAIRTHRTGLILPHPSICARGFVLRPLAEITPNWRHPMSGLTVRALLARNPQLARGVRRLAPATEL